MRCVMVMFDSLNRHLLPPYNANTYVHAPNFKRLARRATTFDTSYVCSMPCMPARRDFHTGRPSFLHTNWGPLEPYDDSTPALLSNAGIHTHLASDHYHYWEDGGATYHTRYDTWECFRGQEGDPFVGQVADPHIPDNINGKGRRQDWINRQHTRTEAELPQSQTFDAGLRFIERNHREDRWFLQIECFDPHEPFVSHRKYRDLYPQDPVGIPLFDWPKYGRVTETPEQVDAARRNYAALVSKCDASLGDVLDAFDRHNLWHDTMLVVWTDHGFLLGEHGWWAKNIPPLYEEVAHTPLFIHDPRAPQAAGQRRKSLVQPAIDLGPTLLDFFGLTPTPNMLGRPLASTIQSDTPVRQAAIFGYHGNRINVTDGRYTYLREPATADNGPLYTYTLMPTAMRGFKPGLQAATLHPPLPFTNNTPVLRIGRDSNHQLNTSPKHLLFDLHNDPHQQHPLNDPSIESRMLDHMKTLMQQCDAPSEQYTRMGL